MLSVIALDPGGTTGWAVMSVHPEALMRGDLSILPNIAWWSSGEWGGMSEWGQVREMVLLARAWPQAAVVVEDFVVRRIEAGRDFLSPVRLTAAFEYIMWRNGGGGEGCRARRPVFKQTPSEAKVTCSDARLREWGFAGAGTISDGSSVGGPGGPRTRVSPHARDAVRHALLFLRRAKADAELLHEAWGKSLRVGLTGAGVE